MNLFKSVLYYTTSVIALLLFTQCTVSKKGQNASIEIKEVYYIYDNNKTEDVNPSFNIYISLISENPNIKLDSIYFKETRLKLERQKQGFYAAYSKMTKNTSNDFIMSSDPMAEYGNTLPIIEKPFPFQLKNTECMIGYILNGQKAYTKFVNVKKK